LFWSLTQSWLGRALAATVFVALARLLAPADFGVASSAFLVLSLLSLVTEFGFGDALVNRADLTPDDINLPFYVSVAGAILLGLVSALLAHPISRALGVPALAPYLIGACALLPLMAVAGFQEALYRRALRFRELAMRTICGVALGGVVGVGCALAGLGPWAIIAQFGTQTVVSIFWLWRATEWTPSLTVNADSFRAIAGFGANLMGMRVVDFITLRSVDLIILKLYGPAALGLFSVSARLYQLLMQLFQTSISSVGLSVLSRIADDKARLRRLFIRSSSLSAMVGTPVFIALAALAPEVNRVMFGTKWAGADEIMRPLLLIGSLHCVQFTMGAYLTAVGRPAVLFRLMVLKAAIVLPPLLLFRLHGVAAVATLYACALACELPFILHATLSALGAQARDLLWPAGLPIAASLIAYAAVGMVRGRFLVGGDMIVHICVFSLCFALVYCLVLAISPKVTTANIHFLRGALR
jgi:O-antigen/teichoic acid export membrane protein